jgi:hypothetical protein
MCSSYFSTTCVRNAFRLYEHLNSCARDEHRKTCRLESLRLMLVFDFHQNEICPLSLAKLYSITFSGYGIVTCRQVDRDTDMGSQ